MKKMLIVTSALVAVSVTYTADYTPSTKQDQQTAIRDNLPKKVIIYLPNIGKGGNVEAMREEIKQELKTKYQLNVEVENLGVRDERLTADVSLKGPLGDAFEALTVHLNYITSQ